MIERYLPRTEFSSYEDFFNNYKVNVPEDFNFGFDVVDAWANEDEKKIALVWCDDNGNEKIFTFKDISRLSNKTANMLKRSSIKKGDVVMLILRRRYEYWILATAIHKLGAVLIPGSIQLTSKDIKYRVNAASVKLIAAVNDDYVCEQIELAENEIDSPIKKLIIGGERDGFFEFFKEIENEDEHFVPDEINHVTDTFLTYFTSGTTGMPKMVSHNFSYPLGHIVTAKYWQCVQENTLHMSVSDSGWAKFGWGKIYGQWLCGAAIFAYDMDKFVPLKLLEKISHYKITTFCAPPTMFRFMLQEDLSKFDLSSIKHCAIAGEPLNPEVYKKWLDATGIRLTEGFGQSESTVMLANFKWFEPKPGSTGKPSPLYNISLLDADGNICEDGEEGEIAVSLKSRPIGLFTHYEHDDGLTKTALGGEFYNTGDVAWRDSDGYYWFVGRSDDVIKCSGYRIGPFEVESALLTHPSVVECAITGADDPVRGQVVKATIILARGYKPSNELIKELQEHVKHVTAPYKYPRIIEFVDELPKTIGGKIKRKQIREEDKRG